MRGIQFPTIHLPALTAGKVWLQGSYDRPDAAPSNWQDAYESDGTTRLEYASNSGGFALDGDYVARFMGFNWLRVATENNQAAERTLNYSVIPLRG